MIFHPQNPSKNSFVFAGNMQASAHPCLHKPIFCEFWHNFSYRASALTLTPCSDYLFSIGDVAALPLDSADYSIRVTPVGLCVCGRDEQTLIRGLMTLLDRFTAVDGKSGTAIQIACDEICERADIAIRMVHYCVFPETELWELQRFLRFCGALKYTHVVLEFWGMLQYDCVKELAWPNAFTKDQVRPLIGEARELGLEIVPMFNHWGHASAGRVMHGKHVVLDQNPTLQTYFSEDGWCWDIRSPKVRALLRLVRAELTELCGKGGYFHIGCDEAYNFSFTNENMAALADFINEIGEELAAVGRRLIIWGDMLLSPSPHYNLENRYTCNAPAPEVEAYFLKHLRKDAVIADWQYWAPSFPVETAAVFRNAGFDCLLCPWDTGRPHAEAALATVKSEALMGYMHTTWHTLSKGMPYVTLMAAGGYGDISAYPAIATRTHTAALLRRVMPAGGDYERAGWSKHQIDFKW